MFGWNGVTVIKIKAGRMGRSNLAEHPRGKARQRCHEAETAEYASWLQLNNDIFSGLWDTLWEKVKKSEATTYLVSCSFSMKSPKYRLLPSGVSLYQRRHIPVRKMVYQSSMFFPGGSLKQSMLAIRFRVSWKLWSPRSTHVSFRHHALLRRAR